MRTAALLLYLLAATCAQADTANVAKASELLDFDISHGSNGIDIDGDGQISRAEAAGNAEYTLGFDRADRNRNGRITAAEWQRYEQWRERRAKAREARLARAKAAKDAASAGGTAAATKKKPARSAP
jgi:hypothetical protein